MRVDRSRIIFWGGIRMMEVVKAKVTHHTNTVGSAKILYNVSIMGKFPQLMAESGCKQRVFVVCTIFK